MSKFIAKNNYYGEKNDSWDFTKITLEQLGRQLEKSINSREPFFIWGKERQNEKLRLDNEKQLLILDKIRTLRNISSEFSQLQADAIFSQEFIDNMVADKRMTAEHFFEKALAEQKLILAKLNSDRVLIENSVAHDMLNIESKQIQIKESRAKAERIELINDLLRTLKDKISSENLQPVFYTYLTSLFLSGDGSQVSDLDMKERLKEILIKQENIKADKAAVEVEDFVNSMEFKKFKNELAKKDALQT